MTDSDRMGSSYPRIRWSAMRIGHIVIVVSLMGLFVLTFWLAMKSRAGSEVRHASARGLAVIGSEEHHFGDCRQGDAVTHDFLLVNQTETPMRIDKLTTSCRCIAVVNAREVVTEPIAPGETTRVSVRFVVPGAQEAVMGRIVVSYHVGSDLATTEMRHEIPLLVRANVLPDYRLDPRELDFGLIDGLTVQQVSRTLRITPVAESVQLHDVTSPNDYLRAEILPSKTDDVGTDIRVTLDVSKFTHNRSIEGSLIVATSSKRFPNAWVPVRGEFAAPVQVEPGTIVIGSDQLGDVSQVLRMKTNHRSQIHAARCPATERVSVRFDNARVARSHELKVIVTPCSDRWLDTHVDLTVELLTDGGKSVFRTLPTPVSSCAGLGKIACTSSAVYNIKQFPNGVVNTDTGATQQTLQDCWQETDCTWDSGTGTCRAGITLPSNTTYNQALKFMNNPGVTCPPT